MYTIDTTETLLNRHYAVGRLRPISDTRFPHVLTKVLTTTSMQYQLYCSSPLLACP